MTATTYTVYFDSSGTPDQDAAVVVAGFIAEDRQWFEFDRNWTDTLRLFGVSALHMREFAHSLGEYTTWKGDKDKRARFLKSLISHLTLRAMHSFVSSVIMKDYRDVDSKYQLHEFSTPLALTRCKRPKPRPTNRNPTSLSVIDLSHLFQQISQVRIAIHC
jgi:hypothetical protein